MSLDARNRSIINGCELLKRSLAMSPCVRCRLMTELRMHITSSSGILDTRLDWQTSGLLRGECIGYPCPARMNLHALLPISLAACSPRDSHGATLPENKTKLPMHSRHWWPCASKYSQIVPSSADFPPKYCADLRCQCFGSQGCVDSVV
jgi:hypothetical protein